MQTSTLRHTAQQWISVFDEGAQRAIAGWRSGGERLGQAARSRWDRAFAESSPSLSVETRSNASHLRDVVAGRYARGLELSATGAEHAVHTLVEAAHTALGGRMSR